MATLHLDVAGRTHVVTTNILPNGKLVVRVDGRITGPPLLPDETEASFLADRKLFLLTRDGEEIRVEPIADAPEIVDEALPPTHVARRDVDAQLMPRAILFIIAGAIWLIGSALFGSIANTKGREFENFAAQVVKDADGMISPEAVRSVMWTRRILAGTLRAQALTGGVILLGAALMLRRERASPLLVEIGTWSAVASAIITFVVIDVLFHRALVLSYDGKAAALGIARWHLYGFVGLMMFALIAGALLSVLNREKMIDLLN